MDVFWQTQRRANVDLTKTYSKIRRAIGVGKLHNQLHMPEFNIATPVWEGASYITTEFNGVIGQNWSLKIPVIKPRSDVDFCLAIRSNFGETVTRYKLWQDVGEDLDYPLYNGQTIPSVFTMEIWSTITNDYTSLLEDYFIPTSVLTPANLCCGEEIPTYELIEDCSLFTPLPSVVPILFNDCYNALPPFIFEEGDILINMNDNYVRNANGEVITWNSI